MAQLIKYSDPEKAYLAGLLHDVGMLVNSLVCTEETHRCVQVASDRHVPIHPSEKDLLGFTHCERGKILAEHWHFSADIISVIDISPQCFGRSDRACLGVADPPQ